MQKTINILLLVIVVFLTGCEKHGYHIGVSQCASGAWRQQMIGEMNQEAILRPDVTTTVLVSHDDSREQAKHIEQLIDMDVDALIISPNNSSDLCDVIEKAYKKNIPVVLVDRMSDAGHYDAFIGGDNRQVGALAANYVTEILNSLPSTRKTKIIEVEGDLRITPVQERHAGFVLALDSLGLKSEAYECNWVRNRCLALTDSLLKSSNDDYIFFCHNDGMGFDVSLKADELGMSDRIHIIGVDALIENGIDMIERGKMEASVRYPTGGQEAMKAALDLLDGKMLAKRDQLIAPFVVTRQNVSIVRMQDETILSLANDNVKIGDQLRNERQKFSTILPWMLGSMVFSVVLCCLLFYLFMVYRRTVRRQKDSEQLLEQYLKSAKSDLNIGSITTTETDDFMSRLSKCLTLLLPDADATVDDLAEKMNMGRSHFYSRVKEKTGYSPMEMLRIARLKQAAMLLEQPDHTVQEVCFLVGFATPSYFAKCFKKYHGVSPSEYQMTNVKK